MSVEVPISLKRLVRLVMRGFYSIEHILVIDMLIRKICMKEDEIVDLLKFERKHLRTVIQQLKNDKILKSRLRVETGSDGKATRQNYYYIAYQVFVNVVKYKLDHMRRKIETEERDNTSRASFICVQCKKTFNDLEADRLCDLTTGEFRCSYCGDIVEEDPNVLPKADSRLILARFNEQIEPLYILLKEVEDLKLPQDLLEPEPAEPSSSIKNESNLDSGQDPFGSRQWKDSDRNRGINTDYENRLFNEQSMTVKIENVDGSVSGLDSMGNLEVKEEKVKVRKEQPAWLTESTIFESSPNLNITSNSSTDLINTSIKDKFNFTTAGLSDDSLSSSKEILEALLIHEKQHENSSAAFGLDGSDKNSVFGIDSSLKKHNDDIIMDSDDEDIENTDIPLVHVGEKRFALDEIDDDIVTRMTHFERESYIRLTQEIYSHLYE